MGDSPIQNRYFHFLVFCLCACLSAQEPQRLAELQLAGFQDESSYPHLFTQLKDQVVFATGSPVALWLSDGDDAINLSEQQSLGELRTANVLGDTVFFLTRSNYPGWGMVRTDGTSAGTNLSTDFPLVGFQSNLSRLNPFAKLGPWFYFLGEDGRRLWRSTIESEVAEPVTDIDVGQAENNEYYTVPVASHDQVFFATGVAEVGIKFWRYDPETDILHEFYFIESGEDLSVAAMGDISNPVAAGGFVYFFVHRFETNEGNEVISSQSLWSYNIALDSMQEVGNFRIADFSKPALGLMAYGDRVLFTAYEVTTGYELWSSSGTQETTELLIDLTSGPGNSYPQGFGIVNQVLIFFAEVDGDVGLWKIDSSFNSPSPLASIWPYAFNRTGVPSEWFINESNQDLVVFFAEKTNEGPSTRGLWHSDGSALGTQLLDNQAWGQEATNTDMGIFYAGISVFGSEPTVSSDGSSQILGNLNQTPTSTLNPLTDFHSAAIGDYVFFTDRNANGQFTVNRSAGSPETTEKLVSLGAHQFPAFSFRTPPAQFTQFRDDTVFVSRDELFGLRLIKVSNGAMETLFRSPGRFNEMNILVNNDHILYFSVLDESNRITVYRSDGSPGNTMSVFEGDASFDHELLLPVLRDDQLFFVYGRYGIYDLFIADNQGSVLLQRVMDQSSDLSRPQYAAIVNNRYLLDTLHILNINANEILSSKLWSSDGTVAGTLLLVELDTDLRVLGQQNSWVYFAVADRNQQLRTDGTPDNTQFVEIDALLRQAEVWVSDSDGIVFSSIKNGQRGLWSTDFQTIQQWALFEGDYRDWRLRFVGGDITRVYFENDGRIWSTTPLEDPHIISMAAMIEESDFDFKQRIPASLFGSKFYFYARDAEGPALWESDGSQGGTHLVLSQDARLVSPNRFHVANNHLYFDAIDEGQFVLWSICKTPDVQINAADQIEFGTQTEILLSNVPSNAETTWQISSGEIIEQTNTSLRLRATSTIDLNVSAHITIPGGCSVSLTHTFDVFEVLESSRWLPHITRSGFGFQTHILVHHSQNQETDLVLQPYDMQGMALAPTSLTIQAGGFSRWSTSELFGSQAVSHVGVITDEEVTVTASYSSTRQAGASAEVHDSSLVARVWRFYSGDWDQVFDGAAIFNPGAIPANIKLRQINELGDIVQEVLLPPVPSLSKTLTVLGDVLQNQPGSVIELDADQAIMPVLLRGDLGTAATLWTINPFAIVP